MDDGFKIVEEDEEKEVEDDVIGKVIDINYIKK
jgi:hypothetical protein